MTIGDILLLASVGLWVVWALFAVFRRRSGGSCCTSCPGGCSGCARNHNRER